MWKFNTFTPRWNGQHFADDILKCIFFNENIWIWIKISLKFVPKGLINYSPSLVQIMAWRRPGNKPLSELMMVSLPTHICVTRPQWVNKNVLIWVNLSSDETRLFQDNINTIATDALTSYVIRSSAIKALILQHRSLPPSAPSINID